jgi:nucleotide-binding universal stress UspA family protein
MARQFLSSMKILIAYDGSDFAAAILDDLRYAGLPQRAEVAVITLAEPEDVQVGKKTKGVVGWLSHRLIEARSSARLARDRIRAEFPGWDVSFEARLAPPPQEIIRKVVEWKPDLVIIGQHGRAGSKRAGLGGVAKRLFKEANCSLRIARARIRLQGAPPRVVIPLAASQNPEAAARAITSRVWPPGTEVKLAAFAGPILSRRQIACGVFDAQKEAVLDLRRMVERRLQSANLLVTSETLAGFPTPVVIEAARQWRADCVFIGVEKIGFFKRMVCGDFVASVAARAACSVEIVRGPIRYGARVPKGAVGANHIDSLLIAS